MATLVRHPPSDNYQSAWGLLNPMQFVQYARHCPPAKPRLGLAATRLFYGIAAHARAYCRSSERLPWAACDYMDGRCRPDDPDVRRLVVAGVLEEFPDDRGVTTWHLTPYGCAVFIAYAPPEFQT